MHDLGEITAIIKNDVRGPTVWTFDGFFDALPELFVGFTFPGECWNACNCHGSGGVVLGREDIARRPAHGGTQRDQCLHQHGRLNGHVQTACDPRALQRLAFAKLIPQRHEAGHFSFGDGNFLAAPVRQ